MKTTIAAFVSVLAFALTPVFAQSPFDGKWVINQAKSDFTGETMTIEDAGNGAIRFVSPDFTYDVKTDGTKAETPSGATVAIEKRSDSTYHQTVWRNGKELSQSDWTLSDGGKVLTIHEFGTRPNGDTFDDTTTYARTTGGHVLPGEWKTTSVKLGNPMTFTIRMGPADQMTWDIPSIKATWKGRTDGSESRPMGPTVPEALTLAVTRQGPHAFAMTEKLKGKVIFNATYTIAEDGKTMTVQGKNAKGETIKEVWERSAGS